MVKAEKVKIGGSKGLGPKLGIPKPSRGLKFRRKCLLVRSQGRANQIGFRKFKQKAGKAERRGGI